MLLAARAPLTFLLRVRLSAGADGRLHARAAGAQGSNLLGTMAHAHALLRVDGPLDVVPAGRVYPAYLHDDALRTVAGPGTP